jgi:hypothetical protein
LIAVVKPGATLESTDKLEANLIAVVKLADADDADACAVVRFVAGTLPVGMSLNGRSPNG